MRLLRDRSCVRAFENACFTFVPKDGSFELLTPARRPLLARNSFVFTTCEVYNPTAPVIGGDSVLVDRVGDLRASDSIALVQDMYGGAARPHKVFGAKVVRVDGAAGEIVFSPPLPSGWFTHPAGIYVLRTVEHTARPQQTRIDCAVTAGETSFTFVEDRPMLEVTTRVICRDESPRLDFEVTVLYRVDAHVYRQSIVLRARAPLAEIYLKNRTIEQAPTEDTYWLWNEGCKLSDGSHCCYTLHNPRVASLELREARSQSSELWINLEDYASQRFRRHVATRSDGFDQYDERSAPYYRAGESASYRFSIFAGAEPVSPPRLSLVPHGYRAAHVWTEHADSTHLRSHRAVYHGHEDVAVADDATGGFVFHRHPVTKSVFFDNPRAYPNPRAENGTVDDLGEMASYAPEPNFKRFVDDLARRDYEICLHTATPDPSTRAECKRALEELSATCGSSVWIDHDIRSSRTCISADGLVDGSTHVMRDVWERLGIRYFWHSASEDYMLKNGRNLDLLHRGAGHRTPTPLYWRHPTVLGSAVTWATHESYLEHFNRSTIDNLVENRGVSIHHGYYPFLCGEARSFLYYYRNLDGKFLVTPKFDEVLAYMARLRDDGELFIGTVGELMTYWLALEQIAIEWRGVDSFCVSNTSSFPVTGLSLVVRATSVRSSHAELQQHRCEGGDVVVWLDLEGGASIDLALVR